MIEFKFSCMREIKGIIQQNESIHISNKYNYDFMK